MGGVLSKGQRAPGGGFTPGSEEQWTPKKIEDTFNRLESFLWENEDICFIGELGVKAEKAGIIKSEELKYVLYQKDINTNDAKSYINKINTILEFRCAKTKKMYPCISAMALKNKHGWTDKTEVDNNIKAEVFQIVRPNADKS